MGQCACSPDCKEPVRPGRRFAWGHGIGHQEPERERQPKAKKVVPPRKWLEADIEGRICYLKPETVRIASGIHSHINGQEKTFDEMNDEGFIIELTWQKVRVIRDARKQRQETVSRHLLERERT